MEDVKIPILILNWKKDIAVPTTQALAFYGGVGIWVSCEMAIYTKEGENMKKRSHCIYILKRLRQFVDLHLGQKQIGG